MRDIDKFIEMVTDKSVLHKNKLNVYMQKQDKEFFLSLQNFLESYSSYLNSIDLTLDYSVDAYLKMCSDMLKCQIQFNRTGEYPVENATHAYNEVYSNKNEMLSYMIGLAISQYLWETHYAMFSELKKELANTKGKIKNYVEIGPGHGLFLKNAIDILGENVDMIAVDISPISLDVTKSIIKYFYPHKSIEYINKDMLELELDSKCDFIVMGEVIEHVDNPDILLNKIHNLLSDSGKAFLSTCVNCPAIDHVYHFRSVEEIRELFDKCGLKILSERVLPVEDLSMEQIIDKKITINYCAIVEKK